MKATRTTIVRVLVGVLVAYLAVWLGSFAYLQHSLDGYRRTNDEHDTAVFLFVYTEAYMKSLPKADVAKTRAIYRPHSPAYRKPPSDVSPFFWVMAADAVKTNRISSDLSNSTSMYMLYTTNVFDALTPMSAKLALQ